MERVSGNLEYQFFFSRFRNIRTLAISHETKVEQIFYQPRQAVCILKTYYNRDVSFVYQRLKSIRHENLTAVYDVLAYNGNTYVIEEFIDGETLTEHLDRQGTFSESEVIYIIEKVCNALEKLHSQRPPLIHRDIKPSNVMIRVDGSIKLIDFDTVRFHKKDGKQDTVLLGTKEYASPEHYGYGQTDITSDIYSIGVMMNELLTGKMLNNHRATYQGRLLPVINRCIRMDSGQRFQSVGELRKVLTSYRTPLGVLTRNKKKIIAGCIVFAAAVSALLFWVTKIETWPDLQKAYEEETSPFLLLENRKVDRKLKKVLGTKYSYVKECLQTIDSDVKYWDGTYFMQGAVPGLYTIMEAAISLTDDEELECSFLEGEICNYYASDEKFYEAPSENMLAWMASFENKTIQFHGEAQDNAEPQDYADGQFYA
ncbi:MAG: serine/threonine-protein kinase [Eubacteriales bacterium]|nr:serine/threonine-protein kinase [Eubacteriales bacterium]